MARLTTLWCTDEDILSFAPGDFRTLCPVHQRLAGAKDGVIAAALPWVLTSATTNFQSQGVASGHVVQLIAPTPTFTPAGDILVVDSASGTSITMRRANYDLAVGEPPVNADVSGITFLIATLGPQIEKATYDINQDYNIDVNIAFHGPTALYDSRQLAETTAYLVLGRQYAAMSRNAGQATDDFSNKATMYREEFARMSDKLQLRWGGTTEQTETQPAATKFSMRYSR